MAESKGDKPSPPSHPPDILLPPFTEAEAGGDPDKLCACGDHFFKILHDSKTAERMFRKALVKDPKHVNALCSLALLLRHAKRDIPGAEQVLGKALEIDKNCIPAILQAADIKLELNAIDMADMLYTRGLMIEEGNADLLLGAANVALYCRKDVHRAEELLRECLKHNEDQPTALAQLASLLEKTKGASSVDTKEVYARAVVANPYDGHLAARYARYLKRIIGETAEADKQYRRAVQLLPNHPGILGNYANFCTRVNQNYEKAEALFERAIKLDGKHSNNLNNYAGLLKRMGKMDHAEDTYLMAIDAAPGDASALGNFANFLKKVRHDIAAARDYYIKALKADPKHPIVQRNYAIFLRDHPDARTDGPSRRVIMKPAEPAADGGPAAGAAVGGPKRERGIAKSVMDEINAEINADRRAMLGGMDPDGNLLSESARRAPPGETARWGTARRRREHGEGRDHVKQRYKPFAPTALNITPRTQRTLATARSAVSIDADFSARLSARSSARSLTGRSWAYSARSARGPGSARPGPTLGVGGGVIPWRATSRGGVGSGIGTVMEEP